MDYRRQMLLPKPVFQDEYLKKVFKLSPDDAIVDKNITDDRATDTSRTVYLTTTWVNKNKVRKQKALFLKTPLPGRRDNPFDRFSRREALFYQSAGRMSGLPIAPCLDAWVDEDGSFLLLLEDVSNAYHGAGEADLQNGDVWLSAARSIAQLHTRFWNGKNIGEMTIG